MQSSTKRALLLTSGSLAVCGAIYLILLIPRSYPRTTSERLHNDIGDGQLLAIHDGYAYLSLNHGFQVARLPASGGDIVECFRFSSSRSLQPEIQVEKDGLHIYETRPVTQSVARKQPSSPYLGAFRLDSGTKPGQGEQWLAEPRHPRAGETRLWLYRWGNKDLQAMPPPIKRKPGLIGAREEKMYRVQSASSTCTRVMTTKGNWQGYAPDTTIWYVPSHDKPQALVRNIAIQNVRLFDGAIGWSGLEPYPDKTTKMACFIGSKSQSLSVTHLNQVDSLAVVGDRFWWIESMYGYPGRNRICEQTVGQSTPRLIEPPLRRSEADVLHVLWMRRAGNKLYLLCEIAWADELSPTPSASTAKSTLPIHDNAGKPTSPIPHLFLVGMNPSRTGSPDFWDKPLELPDGASSLFVGDIHLYFTRKEMPWNLVDVIRDVFSTDAVAQPVRNVLYRIPLPQSEVG